MFGNGPIWIPDEIKEVHGPVSYGVTVNDGRLLRRHIDHIRIRTVADSTTTKHENSFHDFLPPPVVTSSPDNNSSSADPPVRCSSRVRRPPGSYIPETANK